MIRELLLNKNAAEKAEIKVSALVNAGKKKIPKYNIGGIDIEIETVEREGEKLKIIAEAWRGGRELFVDNPLYYVNPPILVPDGTKRLKFANERTIELDNFKEDLERALKLMVAETLRVIIK